MFKTENKLVNAAKTFPRPVYGARGAAARLCQSDSVGEIERELCFWEA